MDKSYCVLPNYKRTLPEIHCPYCDAPLFEIIIASGGITGFGWACTCEQFKKDEVYAFSSVR